MTIDKRELPAGVGELSALITTGTSMFGWEIERDGIPEVVARARERLGDGGCLAIARLAYDLDPTLTFGEAERLVEWGIGHYYDHAVRGGDSLRPGWEAKGELMRQCYAEGIARNTRELGWGVPWVDCVDWADAAARAGASGAVVFTERATKYNGVVERVEVDMFVCDGGDWEAADTGSGMVALTPGSWLRHTTREEADGNL